jgi:LPXTG-motif cell wall-anchored protein
VAPEIEVSKTANPTAVPETGGDVVFTFTVKNTSSKESVTVTSLEDSVYGTLAGDEDCEVGTVLAAGAECSFSITERVEGDYSGPDHVNVFTAKAEDNDGTEAEDSDDATVDFTDVAPTLEVTKVTDKASVPETGGNVVFTFTVTNTSDESVTITGLDDSIYGTLTGDEDCEVGIVLAAGAECSFSITKWVEGDFGGPDHVNVFTGTVVDNDGNEVADTDDATVGFIEVAPAEERVDPKPPAEKAPEVRGVAARAPVAPKAVLPNTGGPDLSLLWAGAAALLTGLAMVVAGRRREDETG